MKSNYKPIGKYIQRVEHRNRDLKVTRLLGLSMTKEFRETTSNIVGTDMSVYRVMSKYQFACDFMSPIRVNKLPVVLKLDDEPNLVSPAYPVFEIKDRNELDPEYLMMWFRRSEFDRYATFKCDAAIRGGYEWTELCETFIPVPSIAKQREIVKEYNVIQNRIALNQQLIQKLEDTAQAIYKQWFVDFEFPDENGKPHKSSGGEMVWNEELQKEIPTGWEIKPITDIALDISTGKTPPTNDKENFGSYMPFITIPDMHNKIFVDRTERSLSQKGVHHQKNKTLPINAICVSCIGTAGLVCITSEVSQTNQQINSVICKPNVSVFYTFFTLRSLGQQIKEWGDKGSVGINMNKTEFSAMEIVKPLNKNMSDFENIMTPIFNGVKVYQKELVLLNDLLELINAKMSREK